MKRGRNHQRRRQGPNLNRSLDSNGPDVRIRGTANQIYDKYQALARDASTSGDRVKAENYLQHAEHYYRVIRAIQPQQPVSGEFGDSDGDQPAIGGGGDPGERDRREQQSEAPAPSESGDDQDEDAMDAQPEIGAHRLNGSPEGAQGDHDRDRGRRRRRPRRHPRVEGETPAEGRDEDEPSPTTVS